MYWKVYESGGGEGCRRLFIGERGVDPHYNYSTTSVVYYLHAPWDKLLWDVPVVQGRTDLFSIKYLQIVVK